MPDENPIDRVSAFRAACAEFVRMASRLQVCDGEADPLGLHFRWGDLEAAVRTIQDTAPFVNEEKAAGEFEKRWATLKELFEPLSSAMNWKEELVASNPEREGDAEHPPTERVRNWFIFEVEAGMLSSDAFPEWREWQESRARSDCQMKLGEFRTSVESLSRFVRSWALPLTATRHAEATDGPTDGGQRNEGCDSLSAIIEKARECQAKLADIRITARRIEELDSRVSVGGEDWDFDDPADGGEFDRLHRGLSRDLKEVGDIIKPLLSWAHDLGLDVAEDASALLEEEGPASSRAVCAEIFEGDVQRIVDRALIEQAKSELSEKGSESTSLERGATKNGDAVPRSADELRCEQECRRFRARWFRQATKDGLSPDQLRKAPLTNKKKIDGEWRYEVEEVCQRWPEYAPLIRAELRRISAEK